MLSPEPQKLCEKDKTLSREVKSEHLACINSGRRLTSVKMSHLIINNLATDRAMLAEVTSADLLAIKWRGEDKAQDFLFDWLAVDQRLESEAMSQKARMNMFWNQVRQSERVAMALHKWSDKPVEERTYDELLERFRAWIVDRKKYENFLKVTSRASAQEVRPTMATVTEADGSTKKDKANQKK